MCDEAKKYAETLAQKGGLEHSSKEERDGQGENLSYGCSSTSAQTIEEAVTNWWDFAKFLLKFWNLTDKRYLYHDRKEHITF